jgi:hypothetical protein
MLFAPPKAEKSKKLYFQTTTMQDQMAASMEQVNLSAREKLLPPIHTTICKFTITYIGEHPRSLECTT